MQRGEASWAVGWGGGGVLWQTGRGVRGELHQARFQAHGWGGREPSQEFFAPKAASPRTGGELRLPLAAEQTPLGEGALLGRDCWERGVRIRLLAPQPHCRVHLPGASRLVGSFSLAAWVRRGRSGFRRGKGQHPVVGEETVLPAWVGDEEGRAC